MKTMGFIGVGIMGKPSVVWVGASGSGQMTKLANQIVAGLNIIAVSAALVLAAKGGLAQYFESQAGVEVR